MIVSMMVASLLIGALLTGAATVLHAQERSAQRSVRFVWAAAIALTVVLTTLAPFRSHTSAAATASNVALPTLGYVASPSVVEAPWQRALHGVRDAVDAVTRQLGATLHATNAISPRVQRTALVSWLATSIAMLLLLAVVYRRVQRTSRTWQRTRLLDADVRVSQDAGPAVVGLRPMEVVVPAWILTRPEAEQRLVLSHEHEHIRTRDPLLLLGACVLVALMPWNPFLWYALSRLRLAVEIDCDRRVLERSMAPLEYGSLLLDLSQHPSSLAGSLPALAYSTSHLERRLLAMTSRPARFIVARRVSGAIVAVAALLAACESKLPTSAEVEAMDATKMLASASRIPGVDTSRVAMTIDGKPATVQWAKSLDASRIASIEVTKGAQGTSEIRMKTRSPDSLTLTASKVRLTGDEVSATGMKMRRRDDTPLSPTGQPMMRSKTTFDGIFVIDGTVVSEVAANTLNPDRIQSVEVIKGAAATSLYSDPRAVNGVIKITTKK